MNNNHYANPALANNAAAISEENARFMAGVYRWMTVGILLTALISSFIGSNPDLVYTVMTNKVLFWGLIIAQFGSVIYLSTSINKMSAMTASIVYLVYSCLTGVTLSVVFVAYTGASIQSAFFTTVFSFAGLSIFGYVTKRDLGPIGTFCHMALWGLIGFSLLSFFFPSLMSGSMSTVYSIGGIAIFAGLTAYDTQKIKQMNILGNEGTEENRKETIMGALTLYLDFINLFLFILRFTGDRRK